MKNVWKVIEHNRFSVLGVVVGILVWCFAGGCVVEVDSPLSGRKVDAGELKVDFDYMVGMFEKAGEDLQKKQEQMDGFNTIIVKLASGNIKDWGSLVTMLLAGGFFGVVGDNVRKNGVIGGLKKGNQVNGS